MRRFVIVVLALCLCMASGAASRHRVLVDAESFDDLGGWVVDQQSYDLLGSPYIMAHGAGKPVSDAHTEVRLPHGGCWTVYVRTHNWTSPWSDKEGPGAFRVVVDGYELDAVCGTAGSGWMWQEAGTFDSAGGSVSVSLRDLTGFEGRCDALLFSDRKIIPDDIPNDIASVTGMRRKLLSGYFRPVLKEKYDLVVVGAGIAGINTAVSAARLGLKVALVHDRPVLGGNNSTEVRVRLGGGICLDPYPNLGNLLLEYAHDMTSSAGPAENYQEWKKEDIIAAEHNITLFRNFRAMAVRKRGTRIRCLFARENCSGELIRLKAPLFADCTGDGSVGVMAGADYAEGSEAGSEYGEESAPEEADRAVIGASVQWNTRVSDAPVAFPEFEYGLSFTDESVYRDTLGRWFWETGWDRDMVNEVELIRDHELLAIYSNWSYLKNHSSSAEEFACRDLDWVQFILGKRESRRLLGDVVFSERDIDDKVQFDDAAVTCTWDIDLHGAHPANLKNFGGNAFRGKARHKFTDPFSLPYRCFYSRNVDNLFMAGRDISVTHVALGATRVMRTCSMMGEVVGMAASVCHGRNCLPREVYTMYLDDLKSLMSEGVGKKGQPNTQDFYIRNNR